MKFINKPLSSSLPVDVGQVWAEQTLNPRVIITTLLLGIDSFLYNSFSFANIIVLPSSATSIPE